MGIAILVGSSLAIGLGIGLEKKYLNVNYVVNNYLNAITGNQNIKTKLYKTNNTSTINFTTTEDASQYDNTMTIQADKDITSATGEESGGFLMQINPLTINDGFNTITYNYLLSTYEKISDPTGMFGLLFFALSTNNNSDATQDLLINGYENAPNQNLSLTLQR